MFHLDFNHFECVILKKIAGLLKDVYGTIDSIDPITLERKFSLWSKVDNFMMIERDIKYSLAYKGDGYLVDLCNALNRIKEGTFGKCLMCKDEISPEELEKSPTSRLCSKCAEQLHVCKTRVTG
jgi:RNA polymerase-binding transcription factor DksA